MLVYRLKKGVFGRNPTVHSTQIITTLCYKATKRYYSMERLETSLPIVIIIIMVAMMVAMTRWIEAIIRMARFQTMMTS